MPADIGTKILAAERFEQLRKMVGMKSRKFCEERKRDQAEEKAESFLEGDRR